MRCAGTWPCLAPLRSRLHPERRTCKEAIMRRQHLILILAFAPSALSDIHSHSFCVHARNAVLRSIAARAEQPSNASWHDGGLPGLNATGRPTISNQYKLHDGRTLDSRTSQIIIIMRSPSECAVRYVTQDILAQPPLPLRPT